VTCSRYRRIFLFTFCFIIFSASVTWSNNTADEFKAAFPGAGTADMDSLPAFSITVFGGIGGYLPMQIGSFDRTQWAGGAGAELLIRRRFILDARGYTGGIIYGTSGYTQTYGFTAGIATFLFPRGFTCSRNFLFSSPSVPMPTCSSAPPAAQVYGCNFI
jgi:hypothetical protein